MFVWRAEANSLEHVRTFQQHQYVYACAYAYACVGKGEREREEKGYVDEGVGLGTNEESCLGKKVLSSCVPSIPFWPNAFGKFSKTPVASSHVPFLAAMHLLPSSAWPLGFRFFFQICSCFGLLWRQLALLLLTLHFSYSLLGSELCVARHLEEHLSCMGCAHPGGLSLCAQADVTSLSLPTGGSTPLALCCEWQDGHQRALRELWRVVKSQADLDFNSISTVNNLTKTHWAPVSPSVQW